LQGPAGGDDDCAAHSGAGAGRQPDHRHPDRVHRSAGPAGWRVTMAIMDIVSRRSRLDRQFDQLRRLEEAGLLKPATGSRFVRKFLNNRLAVFGLVVFTLILLASIFAPLLTPWNPTQINRSEEHTSELQSREN